MANNLPSFIDSFILNIKHETSKHPKFSSKISAIKNNKYVKSFEGLEKIFLSDYFTEKKFSTEKEKQKFVQKILSPIRNFIGSTQDIFYPKVVDTDLKFLISSNSKTEKLRSEMEARKIQIENTRVADVERINKNIQFELFGVNERNEIYRIDCKAEIGSNSNSNSNTSSNSNSNSNNKNKEIICGELQKLKYNFL